MKPRLDQLLGIIW